MARKFMIPQTVWTGADALTHAETDICVLGNKALIVAGQSMIRQGHMKRLTELLERNPYNSRDRFRSHTVYHYY